MSKWAVCRVLPLTGWEFLGNGKTGLVEVQFKIKSMCKSESLGLLGGGRLAGMSHCLFGGGLSSDNKAVYKEK